MLGLWRSMQTRPSMQEAWLYPTPICTGLGDRLGLILSLSALASLHGENCTVYMEWCTDPSRAYMSNPLLVRYIPHWVGYDYVLQDLRAHVSLPSNVKFFPSHSSPAISQAGRYVTIGHSAPEFQGIPQVSTLYWKALKFSDTHWTEEQYVQAYKQATRRTALEGEPYVLVHFRGPDRNTFWQDGDSFCTIQVLRKALRTGIRMRTVTNNYTHAMHWLKRMPSVEIVHLGNSLTNLQLALGATAIVQHAANGWSAFTSVPAMAKSIPLINTYSGFEHRYKVFAHYGRVPPEFHTCDQIDAFLHAISRHTQGE